ncbi:MAG TPA: sugar-binding domain-containing protein [Bauldia sp.]|nr:sugar-binding domain-containing protein [Bauldia sp.]
MTAVEKQPVRLPSDTQREQLMVQAAKLFFDLDRTQTEIASELGLTRWQVSRLLQEARELGIVRIDIVPRARRRPDLESALQKAFRLREAIVVPAAGKEDPMLFENVAHAAAQHLAAIHPRPNVVGVSWGRTMAAVARAIPPHWNPGAHIVQVNGAVALRAGIPRTNAVAEDLAAAAPGQATLLPVPAIVGSPETRLVLEKDRIVADVLALARRAEVLCFSFGALSAQSVLVESGYLTKADVVALRRKGAVGDILGRFVDADGRIVDDDLDRRTIGLRLEDIGRRAQVIGVSAGPTKHAIAIAALRRAIVNVIITDEATARFVLEAEAAAGKART